jgi:hypothetical protein
MRAEDFFTEIASTLPGSDPWDTTEVLDEELLEKLRRGKTEGRDDLEAAQGLVELAHEELQAYGTNSSNRLNNREIDLVIKTMHSVLARIGIDTRLPFRDFERFRSYWTKNGGHGSWQARRDILNDIFDPIDARILSLEERSFNELVDPVSPRTATGWAKVDEEIDELRRKFRSAGTPQDYRAIGTNCVGVVEELSRVTYDAGIHLRPGEEEPPVNNSKNRLDRVIETALSGQANEELRGLAKRAVAVAHLIKHKTTPTRREAGIAADTVILLSNIIRRLAEDS